MDKKLVSFEARIETVTYLFFKMSLFAVTFSAPLLLPKLTTKSECSPSEQIERRCHRLDAVENS